MINFYYQFGQTPIDEEEKLALIPSLSNLDELNRWEQENIIEARKWVLNSSILKKNDIFDNKFLIKIHNKMFSHTWQWAGKLRQSNKNIGCEYYEILIELRKLGQDTEFWLNNNIYSIKQLALVYHHRLVKIHLFSNGNGRHARLVADCIIKRYQSDTKIKWEGNKQSLSIQQVRKKYIEALRKADFGSYKELFELF